MIQIIDDDTVYTEALTEVLRAEIPEEDFEAYTEGEPAIASVDEYDPPNVVILDMMVPYNAEDLTGGRPPTREAELPRGIEILEGLVKAGVKPERVVVITALIQRELAEQLKILRVPGRNILFKPARVDQISSLVKSIRHK